MDSHFWARDSSVPSRGYERLSSSQFHAIHERGRHGVHVQSWDYFVGSSWCILARWLSPSLSDDRYYRETYYLTYYMKKREKYKRSRKFRLQPHIHKNSSWISWIRSLKQTWEKWAYLHIDRWANSIYLYSASSTASSRNWFTKPRMMIMSPIPMKSDVKALMSGWPGKR